MIWEIGRYLISFFLPSFYKRIQAVNMASLQAIDAPCIIAMNHPNAFTDPLLFCYLYYPKKAYFLARGDAFRPGLITYLLESLLIVPIFRVQDGGKEGLKKNDESYQRVNHLLGKNKKIIVFAEGLCVQERRLRPLKKGVARMVFGAYESLNSDKLLVIPVGVNYSQPDKFRSNAFYNIGEPIAIKDFIEEYKENPARTYNKFLQVLEPRMRDLITHINDKKNDQLVLQVEELCKKDRIKERGLKPENLEHDYIVLKELTETINQAAVSKPELLEELRPLADAYFTDLKKNKLEDWLLNPKQNRFVNWPVIFLRSLVVILGVPLFLVGLVGNYLPFRLAHALTRKIVKNVEFFSSIIIGTGTVLFPIMYILWFTVIYSLTPNVLWPLGCCFVFVMAAWFSLYYYPFAQKTLGMVRAQVNKKNLQKLAAKREKLLSLINKF